MFSNVTTYSTGDDFKPLSLAIGDGNGSLINRTWYPLAYDSRHHRIVFKDLNNNRCEDIAITTYGLNNVEIVLNLC